LFGVTLLGHRVFSFRGFGFPFSKYGFLQMGGVINALSLFSLCELETCLETITPILPPFPPPPELLFHPGFLVLYTSPHPPFSENEVNKQPNTNTHKTNQPTDKMAWTPPTSLTATTTTNPRPIAILGAGVLGRRIACTFVAAGYLVHIRDPSPSARAEALSFIDANKSAFRSKLNPTPYNYNHLSEITTNLFGNYAAHPDIDTAVRNAWLVIEAVPEKLDLKIDIMAELAAKTPRDCNPREQ